MTTNTSTDFIIDNNVININDGISSSDELISNFDTNNIITKSAILILGSKNSGKTKLATSLTNHFINFKKVDYVYIFTTDDHIDYYKNCYNVNNGNNVNVCKYTKNILKNILDFQDKLITEKRNGNENVRSNGLILLDNLKSLEISKDTDLMELLFNGRHYGLTFIFTWFNLGLSKELTCNMDFIFTCYENNHSFLKRHYDYYFGMFPSYKTFLNTFKKYTQNGHVIVVYKKNCFYYDTNQNLEISSTNNLYVPNIKLIDSDNSSETESEHNDVIYNILDRIKRIEHQNKFIIDLLQNRA